MDELSEKQKEMFCMLRKVILPQLDNVRETRAGLQLVIAVCEYAAQECREALGEVRVPC